MSTKREYMDCRYCSEARGHTLRAGCVLAVQAAQEVNNPYEVSLPVYSGVFNITHPELGIVATITVTEVEDEEYQVHVEETLL